MLVFGHVGITLGTAVFLTGVLGDYHSSSVMPKRTTIVSSRKKVGAQRKFLVSRSSWLISLGRRIDMRFLLLGSLIPDIIDKPVGQVLFREFFSNGRIFSHTLLFTILATSAGLFFYKRYGKTWLLILPFGTFAHLILDQIWRSPRILLWPLLGVGFERINLTGWIDNIWYALFTDATVYIPELIGALILVWFIGILLHTRKVRVLIKYGRFQ